MDDIIIPSEIVFLWISVSLANSLSLPLLPYYFHIILGSFVGFTLIEWFLPLLLSKLAPNSFGRYNPRLKQQWMVHVNSMVHILSILPLVLQCLNIEHLQYDKAFGYSHQVGRVHAISCGFLWDSLDAIWNFNGVGFILHGIVCLMIYIQAYRPFVCYYGPRFLLWEISTIFLNIHWALDKLDYTGSIYQLVNGAFLMFTFVAVRLIYGGWTSIQFFGTMKDVEASMSVPLAVVWGYRIGNIILQSLNWFWFYKMILALRKRFPGENKGVESHKKAE